MNTLASPIDLSRRKLLTLIATVPVGVTTLPAIASSLRFADWGTSNVQANPPHAPFVLSF